MGNYNPSLPVILGQEWVPIRDESLVFSPTVNSFESGTGFTLSASKVLASGSFYLHEPAPARSSQAIWTSVYARGTEDQSGPIHSVVIPVNNGGVTGTGVTAGGGSVAAATYSPSDAVDIVFQTPDGNLKEAGLFFATNAYSQLLQGKRIVGISFLYAGYGYSQDTVTNDFIPLNMDEISDINLTIRMDSGFNLGVYGPLTGFVTDQGLGGDTSHPIVEVSLGETWPSKSPAPLPLTYADLALFEASAGVNRYYLEINLTMDANGNPNNVLRLGYAALKVYYCEETRLAVSAAGGLSGVLNLGVNRATMYSAVAQTTNPVLTAGDYTVTLSAPNMGDLDSSIWNPRLTYPKLNAVREVYSLPTIPGINVLIPSPITMAEGQAFTVEDTHVLPQISLATSDAPLTEVHVYGRQVIAQVWGLVYAQQEFFDTPVGGATEFPWVRFYARRWGNTTIPLTLTGQGGLSGSSVSITPDEFDELPEVLDGWKEVSLQFATPPVMGALTNPSWRWTATGELAGSRWEVLGASAPAISGIPGNLQNLAPAAQQLYNATYYEPTGALEELQWVPQGVGSPYISGAGVDDDSSDAFIIFAQMPAAVTGFGVTTLCQAVTGIGQDCDVDPCCVPSSISFNQITWDIAGATTEVLDTFTRDSVNAWGTADSGQVYTDTGGAASDYNVADGVGTHTLTSANVMRHSILSTVSLSDLHQRIKIALNIAPASGASIYGALTSNYVNTDNYDFVQLRFATTGAVELVIGHHVEGVTTDKATATLGGYSADEFWYLDIDVFNGQIRAKAWPEGALEPADYQVTAPVGPIGLRLPGTSGNYASTPDDAALDITGDIDLRADVTMSASAWDTGTPTLLSKWDGAQRSYRLDLNGSGAVTLSWSTTGADTVDETSTVAVPTGSSRLAIRATLDVNNGGGGSTATFYTAPTIDGSWTQLGAPVIGAITSIFNSTAQAAVGARNSGTSGLLTGTVHAIEILNGINGTAVANPQFNEQATGTTSFADAAGRTWTVNTSGSPGALIVDDTGAIGPISIRSTGNTDGDAIISYDDYIVGPSTLTFGHYELQRMDEVDTEWQTIMKGSSLFDVLFNDFEARVGITTSYRIRSVDLYGFWGEWSDTITALITEPGVTIGCRGDGHVLIFTSNERQDGSINLAYSSVWMQQQVTEDFTFPEANFVQLQPMYDRDYFTAFRPLERGGEQFTRTLLVQAAAISPPTLGDFRSLRDMAWESVNYICVRDEDGNRWFATVGVPSGRVMNSRKLYLAPVQVVEVTITPTPIDPADESVAGTVIADTCDSFECDEVVAEDSFDRVEASDWGEADLGGDWEESL